MCEVSCPPLPLNHPVHYPRDYLLQLPHNTSAFSALAGLGAHPAFKDLPAQLGLPSRAMAQRLASTLSQLAHWCPVFGERAKRICLWH